MRGSKREPSSPLLRSWGPAASSRAALAKALTLCRALQPTQTRLLTLKSTIHPLLPGINVLQKQAGGSLLKTSFRAQTQKTNSARPLPVFKVLPIPPLGGFNLPPRAACGPHKADSPGIHHPAFRFQSPSTLSFKIEKLPLRIKALVTKLQARNTPHPYKNARWVFSLASLPKPRHFRNKQSQKLTLLLKKLVCEQFSEQF